MNSVVISSQIPRFQTYSPELSSKTKLLVFRAASYLLDPICKTHEFLRRAQIVDRVHASASRIANFARKFFLVLGAVFFAFIALFATLPGIALRAAAIHLQTEPYIHLRGDLKEQPLQNDAFSLLSWNICGVNAGYSITDAGVVRWPARIDAIIKKIQEKQADVVCLHEVFDVNTAHRLCEKLKKEYAHFYLNIGPRSIGVSSGLFIASKFEIKNPEFTVFPKEMLVGRTKHAEKGVFGFDIPQTRIFSTHLQHSEECSYPTSEEKEARKQEMQLIMNKIRAIKGKTAVLTGDLNLDDEEYRRSSWSSYFQRKVTFLKKTWGGNVFSAQVTEGRTSQPLNLDYTLIPRGITQKITTSAVETNFDAAVFDEKALSDHLGLFSKIRT